MNIQFKDVVMAMLIILLTVVLVQTAIANPSEEDNKFCLAQNIYFESGNQPLVGRVAVAQVTLNRVEDNQFPNSICGVVYQAKLGTNWRGEIYPLRHKCQFSWFCDGKSDRPTDSRTWIEAIRLAGIVIDVYYPDITEGALWYHSDAVSPYWSEQLNRPVTIDNHLFYN